MSHWSSMYNAGELHLFASYARQENLPYIPDSDANVTVYI